jgi:hypothetical protein
MAAHARVRTRPAPRTARRVSGPVPRPRPVPAGPPLRRGSTGVFERIRALPETRLVDGLLRGRVWIWLLGILLGGIVAMQVSLLKLNAGISRAVTTASTLERSNAEIEAQNAELSSIERVRDAATADGMVAPAPGDLDYLHARVDRDAAVAARRIEPPSDAARAIMENNGFEPGVLAAAAAPLTTDPAAVATPDPATATTTTATTPAPTPTPVPTATPAETATPPAAQDGAAVAPQG